MRDNENGNATTTTKQTKPLRFAARRDIVYDSLRHMICKAKSGTYAKRIANALNKHVPDERGQ